MMQFDAPGTPKALANASPGLPQPWVKSCPNLLNSEGVPIAPNTFSVSWYGSLVPRVEGNPGLVLANAFGVSRHPLNTASRT